MSALWDIGARRQDGGQKYTHRHLQVLCVPKAIYGENWNRVSEQPPSSSYLAQGDLPSECHEVRRNGRPTSAHIGGFPQDGRVHGSAYRSAEDVKPGLHLKSELRIEMPNRASATMPKAEEGTRLAAEV